MDQNSPRAQPAKQDSLEHERLSSLINSMADGVIAIDDAQKIAVYNGATLNILDINTAITNKQISSVLALFDKNDQLVNVSRLIAQTNRPYANRDFRLKYKDGSQISLYMSVAPVQLGYGQSGTKGHVILLRDITREKSLEEEKEEFISVASHELRTPVTIAEGNIGNAQVILDKGGDKATIQEALRQAHDQIVFLSEIINDLSTLSRAERDKLTVKIESVNVHQLINDLLNDYSKKAADKSIGLRIVFDPSLELLNTSKMYLREILQNFIINGIKYTEQGEVVISVKKVEKGVQFSVADSGIGISRNDQARIFNKFFRSEDYRTRQNSGTGLGLYVTLKLSQLLKAEIQLQSELNKGSVFTITVPSLPL